jgi:D-tyrosyl-tRNA(Tyr) deacylase
MKLLIMKFSPLPCYLVTLITRKSKEKFKIRTVHGPGNNIYLLQMGCHPVTVITLHVFPNTDNKFT